MNERSECKRDSAQPSRNERSECKRDSAQPSGNERSECKRDSAQPSRNERSECKRDSAQPSGNERSECKRDSAQRSTPMISIEKALEMVASVATEHAHADWMPAETVPLTEAISRILREA